VTLKNLLASIPDGTNATESLDWVSQMRQVVEGSRPAAGILDEPELLPTDSELAEDEVDIKLPSPDEVLVRVNRVDRDLHEQKRLMTEQHQRFDSDDDDDDEKKALKKYIRIMEPAYYGLNGLVRTLITKVANSSVDIQKDLSLVKVDLAKVVQHLERVDLNRSQEKPPPPPMPESNSCFESFRQIIANHLPANLNLFDSDSFGQVIKNPYAWLASLIVLAIHFFDSQIASWAANNWGIRRSCITKLSA
jgi:hypothetical protein